MSSMFVRHNFHETQAHLRCSNNLLTLPNHKLNLIALAELHTDMNIKVAAFTVTQKLNYTTVIKL